jgi:hypothetical protein
MVITFSQLGNYGRIANCLFEIAATIGHAERNNVPYLFPLWEHKDKFVLDNCWSDKMPKLPIYEEPHFHFAKIPNKTNLNLHGYFQSYKYFEDCKDKIRNLLTPKDHDNYPFMDGFCSIHVRRTDYLKFKDFHTNLDMNYYTEAMSKVGDSKFIVFSDDPKWCKNAFSGMQNVTVSEEADPIVDFNMQISCSSHIIANSSFSWWAAWLDPNPDKVVIAPKNWFGPKNSHLITKDLIPLTWQLI